MLETSSEKPAPVRVISEAIREYIKRLVQVWVEGEIAQLTDRAGSGRVNISPRNPNVYLYPTYIYNRHFRLKKKFIILRGQVV